LDPAAALYENQIIDLISGEAREEAAPASGATLF
jgi:hypothetical protein